MNPFFSTTQSAQKPEVLPQQDNSLEKALLSILEQEKYCLDQVNQLLKTENEAISQRDTAAMGSLLDKKLPLLSKLEQLDIQRQHYFEQQTGLSYNKQKFSAFIEHHPLDYIPTLWQTIKEQLSECKKQNELIGHIISIRQNNTEQILQILLGRTVNSSQTYSHMGQTSQQKKSALYTAV
ncbi:MAG: flagellar protein FlgN [Gammaproteobacteria bacterium]|nr:flagellar protein FlgN [Gammaproteobacteria bacterium]